MTQQATATPPALTITVAETSVIFEGLVNVYRYDRPTETEIASYVRHVLGPDPGGAVVHAVAEAEVVERLDRAFTGYDVTLTAERPRAGADAAEGENGTPRESNLRAGDREPSNTGDGVWRGAGEDTVRIARPHPGSTPGWVDGSGGWILGAAVVAVSVLAAGAIWASVRGGSDGEPLSPGAEPSVGTPVEVTEAVAFDGGAAGASTRGRPADTPATVIGREGLSVELPPGFSLVPDGEMWRATGEDPNFRLQIAVDNLYQLPPAEMTGHVLREIEEDPEVELVSNDGVTVLYRQSAPDGSETLWKTWSEGGHQLFVGCHTRYAPSAVQAATCRMAMDSAAFDPDHDGAGG